MLKLATKFQPQAPALETAYRAGFRFAEIWLGAAVLADWQTALRQVRAYPNGYVVHFPNSVDLSSDLLKNTVALYRNLECRCLVIHQPMYDKYSAELLALDPHLRLAVENHKLTPPQLENWAQTNPGLTLDVEHLWKFTLRDGPLDTLLNLVRTLFERFGDKIYHVHLPGYWPGFEEHRPMYCAGDDFPRIIGPGRGAFRRLRRKRGRPGLSEYQRTEHGCFALRSVAAAVGLVG